MVTRRNTPAKGLIRELLNGSGSPMSQDMLEERLQGQVDRVTVYRVLAAFCEDGLVHRVVSGDGKAYFALCKGCKTDDHDHEHAHFQCTSCRKIECLPFSATPKLPAGYSFQSMNLWVSGRCGACNRSTA